MRNLLLLPLLVTVAYSVSIKTKVLNTAASQLDIYDDQNCYDANGDCKRPCHEKHEANYGICPENNEHYRPSDYAYNYYELSQQY